MDKSTIKDSMRVTFRIPAGARRVTFHYADTDVQLKLPQTEKWDGSEYFIAKDGREIPLDIPAFIDVTKAIDAEHPEFYVSDEEIDQVTEHAKKLYQKQRHDAEKVSTPADGAPKLPQWKSIAKKALKDLKGNLPPVVLNQLADLIRKRLKTWWKKESNVEESPGQ